ncbi:hypothetical protein J5N97_018353 [Dioscorea zingiberensis]|uniref:Uncharacterized protein n=1 Tax=Dioscorea zingiberensis TaxID=325984 RepID=A0A9D5CPW9_9LILI|nr:hypothetical protein J5N97_018353 [Dioscorea zingiberensis]
MDALHLLHWIPPPPSSVSRPRAHSRVAAAGKKPAVPVERPLKGGWVLKILRVGSLFSEGEEKRGAAIDGPLEEEKVEADVDGDDPCVECDSCWCGDEEAAVEFDRSRSRGCSDELRLWRPGSMPRCRI